MGSGNFSGEVVLQNGQYSYLVDQAIQKVWCNPELDNQHIVSPCRISHPTGVLNRHSIMMQMIELPTQSEVYHIFQIGQLHPLILGLLEESPSWALDRWIPVSEAINQQKLIVDVYTVNGIHLPRYEIFYMYTNDRNLIIAVKQNKSIPINYQKDALYFRFYSNAYFQTLKGSDVTDFVYCHGERILNKDQILSVQGLCDYYKSKKGTLLTFVNGYLTESISLINTKINDVVEFLYDSSFCKSITFDIKDLYNFISKLDKKQKYLLHYDSKDVNRIEYHDDIDIYLLYPLVNDSYFGLYYHRNNPDACRMVTHVDYSVVVDYLLDYADQLRIKADLDVIDLNQLKIILHVRDSGLNRSLIFENNRIQELYKLSDTEIVNAMVGTNSVVPEWRVDNLENSNYTKIMRSEAKDVSLDLVQEGLGYNGCSVLIGNTPSKTYNYSNRKRIDVSRSLSQNATAYEYDANGKLLGFYKVDSGVYYDCFNNNAELVEMISGFGTDQLDIRFGTKTVTVPLKNNYRVYRCNQTPDGPDNNWKDLTGSNLYTVSNGVLTWSEDDVNPYIMVRTDATFLAKTYQTKVHDGILLIKLTEIYKDELGNLIEQTLPVPLGELDVILNGNSLIEEVDYKLEFPYLCILNKKYLKLPIESEVQDIHVRFTGFCNSDLSRNLHKDRGWVKYGLLSKNTKYDIRDDKVLRIVMGGSVYHRNDLKFSETSAELGIVNATNGLPYLIRDIVVPMGTETTKETYSFRALSEAIDDKISGYLTTRLKEPINQNPSVISELYPLFSPFIARIIEDLKTGIIPVEIISKNFLSDNDILIICAPYEYLLKFDPIKKENTFDYDYIVIHPTSDYNVVPLKFYQYHFLYRVVKLYGNDRVDLSSFIMLAPAS